MRIVTEVGHPAHVHYWRNLINLMEVEGHEFKLIARNKESTYQLLEAYGFEYTAIGRNRPTMMAKGIGMLMDDFNLLRISKKFKPDLFLSSGMPYSGHVSRIMGKPHITILDTEIAGFTINLLKPFCDAIITPSAFQKELPPATHVNFDGYFELAYLHPKRFSPDPATLEPLGLSEVDRFILVRLSSWDSSHDLSFKGIFQSQKQFLEILERLELHGRVLLTTEVPLPAKFDRYRFKLPVHKIHDLMYYSSLYIGEGATMASEAGVLGTPWIFISPETRGYLDDQEKNYGLGRTISDPEEAVNWAEELLSRPALAREWKEKREKLLQDKIDVTGFLAWFVNKWPESLRICQEKEIQYMFAYSREK